MGLNKNSNEKNHPGFHFKEEVFWLLVAIVSQFLTVLIVVGSSFGWLEMLPNCGKCEIYILTKWDDKYVFQTLSDFQTSDLVLKRTYFYTVF